MEKDAVSTSLLSPQQSEANCLDFGAWIADLYARHIDFENLFVRSTCTKIKIRRRSNARTHTDLSVFFSQELFHPCYRNSSVRTNSISLTGRWPKFLSNFGSLSFPPFLGHSWKRKMSKFSGVWAWKIGETRNFLNFQPRFVISDLWNGTGINFNSTARDK